MKKSELQQIIREEIIKELNENDEPLTKKELLKLKPGQEFLFDTGVDAFKNKSVVLSNDRKELRFKSDIPGIGWMPNTLPYKEFNEFKNHWFYKGANSVFKFYPV
jgi:hypothetical protein